MNKDDKIHHLVLLINDISKHGAKEMGHVQTLFNSDDVFTVPACNYVLFLFLFTITSGY